jgi:hypothetical protein
VALKTRQIPSDETRLLGTAGDREVGGRDATTQEQQKQENDDQKAIPGPSALILFFNGI